MTRDTFNYHVFFIHLCLSLSDLRLNDSEKIRLTEVRLETVTQGVDESERIKKMLEHRAMTDNERIKALEAQLKEARNGADESDHKYDEVSRKLADVEDDLERAEERANTGEAKIGELEEELKVVSNNVKSLGVAEEKSLEKQEVFESTISSLTIKLQEVRMRDEELSIKVITCMCIFNFLSFFLACFIVFILSGAFQFIHFSLFRLKRELNSLNELSLAFLKKSINLKVCSLSFHFVLLLSLSFHFVSTSCRQFISREGKI